MSSLSAEEQMILFLSRLNPDQEAIEKTEGVLSGGRCSVDYEKLLSLASLNLVTPLFYRNLRRVGDVPGTVLRRLENIYLCNVRKNVIHARETMRIIALLKGEGIDAMPLKGSIVSDMLFGDVGIYLTSDIDLLVKPPDLARTKDILVNAGYGENTVASERDSMRSSYHLSFDNGMYVIEVHWNLVMRYFSASPGSWWEGAFRKSYEGSDIIMPSGENYVLYAIFHLYSHGFFPLKFLFLVSELVNTYREEMNWQTLLSRAEGMKMTRLTAFTLRLAHDLLGADIPEEFIQTKVRGYNLLKRSVLFGFFHEQVRVPVRMLLYTLLLNGPRESIRIVLQRIFPDMSEVRLRYGLPENSKKVYLYYLANPLLLIMRRR